ncbi:hypothetical protein F4802DRAFT_136336 [Xylaria palmicola]|nr:hypothetical protein F4802DRAFT_136336 [Xylaria palmicola]
MEGHSMVETAFSGIWTEILMATASHTSERGTDYALFQCDDQPDMLAIILGHAASDASLEANHTGDGPSPRLLEFVTPRERFVLDMDVAELPLGSEKIAVLFSESQPPNSDSLPGTGRWGTPKLPFGAEHGGGQESESKNKTWIHVAPSEDAGPLSQVGTIRNFSKIMESHVDSKPLGE